jgi:hypothetical protein
MRWNFKPLQKDVRCDMNALYSGCHIWSDTI